MSDPSEDHDKDNFYNQLSAATQSIPPHDILIVLGDFNASSGTYDNVGGVLGPFGSGSPNNNTDRMITYSGMHDLTVLGSWFRRLDVRRWTRYSNDGFTKKELDHILTRQ